MGLLNALFGKKKLSLEKANNINDKFLAKNPIAKNKEDEMMRNASKLMTSKNFGEAMDLYKKLSEEYPEKKGLYESQVGAAYYFLGNYFNAIEYYISAIKNGANLSMMEDNIWEASEALFNKTKDRDALEYYKQIFPNGSYKNKIEKLLKN